MGLRKDALVPGDRDTDLRGARLDAEDQHAVADVQGDNA
jgi:hypothetical protein